MEDGTQDLTFRNYARVSTPTEMTQALKEAVWILMEAAAVAGC